MPMQSQFLRILWQNIFRIFFFFEIKRSNVSRSKWLPTYILSVSTSLMYEVWTSNLENPIHICYTVIPSMMSNPETDSCLSIYFRIFQFHDVLLIFIVTLFLSKDLEARPFCHLTLWHPPPIKQPFQLWKWYPAMSWFLSTSNN